MTKARITRGMLLAAGFGTRLKPLTDKMPKPLIPLNGKRLIDFTLGFLARSGIQEVMINLHHFGEQVEAYVKDGGKYGLSVSYSKEKEIQGTGGGIKKCEAFFQGESFVVLNGDTLIDCNLSEVIAHHHATHADATLVIRRLQKEDRYGPVDIDDHGMVTSINGEGKHFYTGLQIVGPKLLNILPPAGRSSCIIKDGYQPLIKKGGRIATYLHTGYWNDLGTAERYTAAKTDIDQGVVRL